MKIEKVEKRVVHRRSLIQALKQGWYWKQSRKPLDFNIDMNTEIRKKANKDLQKYF